MRDRKRRAVITPADAAGDFAEAALAMSGQPAGAAENFGFFLVVGLREIPGFDDLIAMNRQEALDHAEHEPDAAFAIFEDEPAGGKPAPAPALDCFAGDVEALSHIVDGHHRLRGLIFAEIQGFTDLLD